jgi:hypothetical protein
MKEDNALPTIAVVKSYDPLSKKVIKEPYVLNFLKKSLNFNEMKEILSFFARKAKRPPTVA